MREIAKLLSFIFHPVMFSLTIPFLVVYKQTSNSPYALKWQIFTSLFIILGILWVVFERLKGSFSDYDLSKRSERYLFYRMLIFLAALYLLIAVFFKGVSFPLSVIAGGIIVGIIAFEFVNHYMKASVHLGVVCAWVITIGVLYGAAPFILTLWIIPLVTWARIILKKHTISEAFVGGVLGSIITLLTFFVGKQVYNLY